MILGKCNCAMDSWKQQLTSFGELSETFINFVIGFFAKIEDALMSWRD